MVKRCTLLIILLGLPGLIFSQNLVPNASFECGTDICPPSTNANNFGIYACGWSCPTKGTSDVFTTQLAAKGCYSSVPYNGTSPYTHIGSQVPRTGNRFAGIYCYCSGTSYREYLQVQLQTPLIPGEYYCAEMYISSADVVNYSCNNMGMYFSENKISFPNIGTPLPFTPQIVENNIINDTVNWVKVSGTFKAAYPAEYLIIGNFNNDLETSTVVKVPHGDDYYDYAYYFFDDVSVEHLPQKNFAFIGRTEICQGESTTLKMSGGFGNVTWTTLADTLTILSNADTLTVKPDVTTQYRVTVKNCHLVVKDTITVTIDTFLRVHLGKDTTMCDGASIELNAGALLGSAYEWQDKSGNQYLKVYKAGKYSVNVSNPFNNCVGYDDINISIKTVPEIELGNDTIVCKDFYPLKAGQGGTSFQWSTGSSDSVFIPTKSGRYWVMAENRCGQSKDSIRIYSATDIFIPNVLTLNGDKFNEEFKVALVEDKARNLNIELSAPGKLIVYNRWGHEIFSDNNYVKGWPPGNVDLDAGVYYYTFNYLRCPLYKGWLHIIK